MQELTERLVNDCASGCTNSVLRPLIERSVSSCLYLVYIFRFNGIYQSDARAHRAHVYKVL